MSFSDIIAKVKRRPELWKSSHPYYRHRIVSAKIWKEIATEIRADVPAVRKRWKHLKDQYRKEHKKVTTKIIPMSFWQHYNDLSFLSDEMLRVNTRTFYDDPTTAAAAAVEPSDSDKKSTHSDSDDAPLVAKKPRITAPGASGQRSALKTQEAAQTYSGKMNLILNRLHSMIETAECRNSSIKDKTNNDLDYMFMLSLLPIMKKLTEIQKLQFRGKMNDWLLDIVTHNEYSDRNDYKSFIQNDINEGHTSDGIIN